jgi:hypothetical protein
MTDKIKHVHVCDHDLEHARRRCKTADAETVEDVAVALAAIRKVHLRFGPGTDAAELMASMLPVQMRRNLGRKLAKAA